MSTPTRKTVAKKPTAAQKKAEAAQRLLMEQIDSRLGFYLNENGYRSHQTTLTAAKEAADTAIRTAVNQLPTKQSVIDLGENLKDASTGKTAQWIMIALIGLTAVYAAFA